MQLNVHWIKTSICFLNCLFIYFFLLDWLVVSLVICMQTCSFYLLFFLSQTSTFLIITDLTSKLGYTHARCRAKRFQRLTITKVFLLVTRFQQNASYIATLRYSNRVPGCGNRLQHTCSGHSGSRDWNRTTAPVPHWPLLVAPISTKNYTGHSQATDIVSTGHRLLLVVTVFLFLPQGARTMHGRETNSDQLF